MIGFYIYLFVFLFGGLSLIFVLTNLSCDAAYIEWHELNGWELPKKDDPI